MSANLGRVGWLGIAIESSPGAPLNPTDYIPFTVNTLRGKHEPIADIAARGLRDQQFNSVIGKKHGEGDVETNLDPTFAGYWFKMALGSESSSQLASTGVYDHVFTVAQNSVPVAATLMFDKVAYREIYPYAAVNELELSVADELATLKMSIMSQFPATTTSGTNTTTSGIVFTFKDLTCRFGSTLAAAQVATPTKLRSLNLKISNNLEPIWRSGNAVPDSFATKDFQVAGEFGILLESQAEVTNYYDLTKRYAIFTFTGRGIGGGYLEQVEVILHNIRVDDQPLDTGISDLLAIKSNLVAEYSTGDAKTMQVTCRNRKATSY